MLSMDSKKLWFQLVYDEKITEKEFLESLQSFYDYATQNSKQVTELINRYGGICGKEYHKIDLV